MADCILVSESCNTKEIVKRDWNIILSTVDCSSPTGGKKSTALTKERSNKCVASMREKYECEMVHAPSLDCAGMVSTGSMVYCTKNQKLTSKTKYAIQHCEEYRSNGELVRVGYHPAIAESICKKMLQDNLLTAELGLYDSFLSQQTFKNSRVDFVLERHDKLTLLEVKNVVGADYPIGGVPCSR